MVCRGTEAGVGWVCSSPRRKREGGVSRTSSLVCRPSGSPEKERWASFFQKALFRKRATFQASKNSMNRPPAILSSAGGVLDHQGLSCAGRMKRVFIPATCGLPATAPETMWQRLTCCASGTCPLKIEQQSPAAQQDPDPLELGFRSKSPLCALTLNYPRGPQNLRGTSQQLLGLC